MSVPVLSPEEVRRALGALPRLSLAHLPTPLDEAPRFAERIAVGRVLIKRDDWTGLLFGGNKTRHIDFLLAHPPRRGTSRPRAHRRRPRPDQARGRHRPAIRGQQAPAYRIPPRRRPPPRMRRDRLGRGHPVEQLPPDSRRLREARAGVPPLPEPH